MNKIKVIVKHTFLEPMVCEVENTLEELQMIVGGNIEVYAAMPGVVVICNEMGRLYGLPLNAQICGENFVGTVVIAGIDGEDFADVPDCMIKMYGERS